MIFAIAALALVAVVLLLTALVTIRIVRENKRNVALGYGTTKQRMAKERAEDKAR